MLLAIIMCVDSVGGDTTAFEIRLSDFSYCDW